MTSRPAAHESETPETDRFGQWPDQALPDLGQRYHELWVIARSLERRLSLALTEIKGHMRITRETIERAEKALQDCEMYKGWIGRLRADAAQAQARIAELEKLLRDVIDANPRYNATAELAARIDETLKSRA